MSDTTIIIGWTRSDMANGYSSFDGYRVGASQHTEAITVDVPENMGTLTIADAVFTATNVPDLIMRDGLSYVIQQAIRATGYTGREAHYSLSVGDTVTVRGESLACESLGWKTVPPACGICHEPIRPSVGLSWTHEHGDVHCGTGDGSVAIPVLP